MMQKMSKADLKKAVEQLHKCSASYIEDLIVLEKFDSDTVWEGTISVFEIKGHPQANKCYAWSSPIDDSTKRRYYAVLHIPPIDSPKKAARSSIIHDHKRSKQK